MILLTGSTGYVGSHIANYFDKKKIDYIGIDNLSYSYKQNVSNKKKHLITDISNAKKINIIFKKYKINFVIHAAASSYVLEAEKNRKKYFINNIKKTKKFINLCKLNKVKNFIFFSSSNVYKEKKEFFEDDITASKNYYGKNKIIIENYLIKKKFNNLIILRLFNVIGIYNKLFKPFKFKNKNYQRIMFQIQEKLKNNKPIKLRYFKIKNKKVYPCRDFIDIKIVCFIVERIIKKINYKILGTKFFNVGSGIATPINNIIRNFEKIIFKKIDVQLEMINKKELIETKANIKKLKVFLKKNIQFDLKKTLNTYIG